MWALNRAVHLYYTIHFHTSLPLIPAEALCMDYWCDMIRVSWCLAQLSFVFWLKYLCGLRSSGNFCSSLSPLGLKPHLVWFEWLFSQAHSWVVAVPVAETLVFNSALGAVTQWASDPLWKVKIHKQSVLQAQHRTPVCVLNLTLVIQQLFSPPRSILCHSSRKWLLLYVCFMLSLQRTLNRRARRLKSCFYLTNRPNYSTNYGIEVSLLFPKLCALFLNVEALLG